MENAAYGALYMGATVLFIWVMTQMASPREDQIKNLKNELFQVQGKLDALLRTAGIKYDPYANLSPRVHQAVEDGKKIEAIKLFREETGLSLADSKKVIERFMP